ncbi:MAG: hypothetical protein J5685_02720 [Clostridiales bacterium]|nr:hypothetical protein [Clostridiales bacterium]
MRRIIAAILVLSLALSLCGCQKETTLKICATRGPIGFSEEEDFSTEYEIKDIKAGDCVYEYIGGELTTECRPYDDKDDWLFKIKSIRQDSVTIVINYNSFNRAVTLDLGSSQHIKSRYEMDDESTHFVYTISFYQ